MDERTTVRELRRMVERFVRERDWEQFHTPKNLSMGMAVEAAELMELFQWHDAEGSAALMTRARARRAAQEELADVMIYCLAFANRTGIDVAGAIRSKLAKNRRKYPVRRFRGRFESTPSRKSLLGSRNEPTARRTRA
ncbi:MAG TPA: nucleotide pyrophosphohydrolase [bacterium]|nr:nucleotide pyrophosphohydrolase [bacterium]